MTLAGLRPVLVALAVAVCFAAEAAPVEPARGSAERSAILDALRPAVESVLNAPVELVVDMMQVEDGWAFVAVSPQRPGGVPIEAGSTRLDTEFLDGFTTYALLRSADRRWNLIAWVVGPTDVAWFGWWDTYGAPRAIFPDG